MMRIFVGVSTTQLKAFRNLTYFMYTSMQICLLSTHSCKFQLQYFHITSRSYESDVLWHLLLQQIGSSVILGHYPSMHLNHIFLHSGILPFHIFLQQIQPPCIHTYWWCLQIKWDTQMIIIAKGKDNRADEEYHRLSLIPNTLFPPM